MEQFTDAINMLDLMVQPGLCVNKGKIIKINQAAQRLLLTPGEDIVPRLLTGREEYAEFQEDCLYLTMDVFGQSCGACVTRMGELDIFLLDQDADQAELQAMALAAKELREPLTNIMITVDRLFPMTAQDGDPHTRDQVARLNRGLFQMLRVVSNMSDAGRCSSGAAAHQELRNVTAFVQEIFGKVKELVLHAGIELRYEGPANPVFSLIDCQLLERAVLNIISNAVKFTPKGGCINAKLLQIGSKLSLTVQDNGHGIEETLRGSIFHRYLRQPALEDNRFGIGLGMVLIRSAAARHGGTVLIDQPADQGSRITMTIAIRQETSTELRSNMLRIDYAGERDHALMELSDCLPAHLYEVKN